MCAAERLRSSPSAGTWGGSILLGLEILIIADIITTITLDQTPSSAITLGIIVLVRTFLSFSLEIELDGVVRGGGRHSRVNPPGTLSDRTSRGFAKTR